MKLNSSLPLALIAGLALVGCAAPDASNPEAAETVAPTPVNPPADGFDLAGSDTAAIQIADRVMESMGGRRAWDDTRFLAWRFFAPPPDGRTHIWDRQTGQVRFQQGDQLTLVNIHTREGSSWKADQSDDPDELSAALQQGYEAWVNDSYWLLMPYKLKDSGVTLRHMGDGETEEGAPADVLELRFAGVGVTPQNKYNVWVSKESSRVEQWAYFATAADEEPEFITPWGDWSRHGDIMLSGNRGRIELTEIAVLDDVPESVFTSPDPVDTQSLPVKP